jgi:pilus assembly protein CpaB
MLLVFGLVLAVGTGVGSFYLLQRQRTTLIQQAEARVAEEQAAVPTIQLPVAARTLAPGTLLKPEDVLLKAFPVDLAPVSAITTTVALDSQILAESVGEGETFSATQLAGNSATRASRRLEEGRVLFAYPITDLLSQSNVIEPGDHLDALITLPVATPDGTAVGPVTAYTLQNITVFDVLRTIGENGERNGDAVALLLSIAPEDAVLLKHAKDSEGTVDFVLRSILDEEPFDAPSIPRDGFVTRYEMR